MINIKNWSKGILSLYAYLPKIADSIDRLVMTTALDSAHSSMNTISSANSMISLAQYKIDLINLKRLTCDSLLAIDKADAKLLGDRFIDGNNVEDCIEVSGKTRRTYFRAFNKALKSFEIVFYSKLCHSGIFDNPPANSFWEDMFSKVSEFATTTSISSCPQAVCNMILSRIRRIGVC